MHYFAVQVRSSGEDEYVRRLAGSRPDLRMKVLRKRLVVRRAGKPVPSLSALFPGYVFLEWDSAELSAEALQALKSTPGFFRILPETRDVRPLSRRDAEIVGRFASFGGEIGISRAMFGEDDRIRVVDGPLKGLEGLIVKVDRRKKRAKIRLDMYDSPVLCDLGYELIDRVAEGEK